jgi:hypothetical protein
LEEKLLQDVTTFSIDARASSPSIQVRPSSRGRRQTPNEAGDRTQPAEEKQSPAQFKKNLFAKFVDDVAYKTNSIVYKNENVYVSLNQYLMV